MCKDDYCFQLSDVRLSLKKTTTRHFVQDAIYADFIQSLNVILAKFLHAVFGIVLLLMRSLHIRSRGLFDSHKIALRDVQKIATL